MKKFAVTLLILVLLAAAVLAGATIVYAGTDEYKNDVFPENTTVNGVDCSGLTYDEAAVKLTSEWNKKHIIITGPLSDTIADYTGCWLRSTTLQVHR